MHNKAESESRHALQLCGETRGLARRADEQLQLVERVLSEGHGGLLIHGQSFVNSVGLEMVWCPPGQFVMPPPDFEEEVWTLDADARRGYRSTNQHDATSRCGETIEVPSGYWMSKTTITQSLWERVVGANIRAYANLLCEELAAQGSKPEFGVASIRGDGPGFPMHFVSWFDTLKFCRALTRLEGQGGRHIYDLPTVVEWWHAATCGSAGQLETSLGIHTEAADCHRPTISPVREVVSESANKWGLLGMPGSIWEWCKDWSIDDGTAVDSHPAPSRTFKSFCGGPWSGDRTYFQSPYSSSICPTFRGRHLGFRVVAKTKL